MAKWISLLLTMMVFSVNSAQLEFIKNGITDKTLSDQDLLELPQTEIATELPWIDGVSRFSGVQLTDIFNHIKTPIPKTMTFVALNNYQVEVEIQDIEKYQPIIANRKNGEMMSVRDKGPFWVIFPLSEYPEIDNTDYHAKMIWQLKEVRY
ncbi:hypothetical protein [Vibrio sp. 10N]|uniref:hypothetical protein n=1 Tax=Vibrio sp. 10N TaxID=3058938 RepID=UPI0028130751|nr:oxidoreductase [Vibrio sp. 10N]